MLIEANFEQYLFVLLGFPCCLAVGLYSWLGVRWITAKNTPDNIAIVYGKLGFYYPLKYRLFRVLLWLRRRQNEKKLKANEASSSDAGYGMKSRNSPADMDKVQVLADGFPMV
ncbi:polyprenol reductase [Elysia marginata]|uniref:Polyprenol reductase n=1 Tax=Elysia marginata TaxID=1093978 RepID=A0AAV4GL91_9GAST|nr:polyprenol reductase [Elysia marginata]